MYNKLACLQSSIQSELTLVIIKIDKKNSISVMAYFKEEYIDLFACFYFALNFPVEATVADVSLYIVGP